MFENFQLISLQQYWWFIVSLLGALLVFLLFVQGGQTLFYSIGKNETERSLLLNTLGRKWELTFSTLVTFGGAFFASFPLFYATSFGGAYWVWMAILFAFVVQAVSYEYRTKPNNALGKSTYEVFLFANGAIATILLGTAVGTFFTGSQFTINSYNSSEWMGPMRGLEAALCVHNLALGLAVFFLSRVLGSLYFLNSIEHEIIAKRARKQLLINALPFLVLFLIWLISLMFREGFAVNAQTREVSLQPYKYWHNILEMPANTVLLLVGVVAVLGGIIRPLMAPNRCSRVGFWMAGGGTVLTVLALFLLAGLNDTAFYPSTTDLQSSLTIRNASSSHYTLTAMSYVSLMVPFVLAYIVWSWRVINRKPLTEKELNSTNNHIY